MKYVYNVRLQKELDFFSYQVVFKETFKVTIKKKIRKEIQQVIKTK